MFPIVPSIWVAAAVVVSAVIAAGVAIWRTRVHLAHDREQKALGELRHVVDETLRTAQNAIYRAREMQAVIESKGAGAGTPAIRYKKRHRQVSQLIRRLNGFQARLAVRLPSDAALPAVALQGLLDNLRLVYSRADQAWPDARDDERSRLDEALCNCAASATAVEAEARLLVRSELGNHD